jgi:hypothetical protein
MIKHKVASRIKRLSTPFYGCADLSDSTEAFLFLIDVRLCQGSRLYVWTFEPPLSSRRLVVS